MQSASFTRRTPRQRADHTRRFARASSSTVALCVCECQQQSTGSARALAACALRALHALPSQGRHAHHVQEAPAQARRVRTNLLARGSPKAARWLTSPEVTAAVVATAWSWFRPHLRCASTPKLDNVIMLACEHTWDVKNVRLSSMAESYVSSLRSLDPKLMIRRDAHW